MKESKFKIGDMVRIIFNEPNDRQYYGRIAQVTEIIPRYLPDYYELPDNYNYLLNIEYENQIIKNLSFSSRWIRATIDKPEYMK
jgi:hypothetical protein